MFECCDVLVGDVDEYGLVERDAIGYRLDIFSGNPAIPRLYRSFGYGKGGCCHQAISQEHRHGHSVRQSVYLPADIAGQIGNVRYLKCRKPACKHRDETSGPAGLPRSCSCSFERSPNGTVSVEANRADGDRHGSYPIGIPALYPCMGKYRPTYAGRKAVPFL